MSIITHHGYTGHEMADSVGLINMNGRWYDPTLGRMMQADPTVSMPENLQSFNRYSYVMNNPLSYTDPTGYRPFWSKRKIASITRDILKDVANSKIYIDGKRYRVGGILAIGLLTNPVFGEAYAWSNRDGKTVTKAYEVAAVIAASVWAGQEAYGAYVASTYGAALAASLFVAESAAIGYTSSYAISRVYGASTAESRRAGLDGARMAALMAGLRVAGNALRAAPKVQAEDRLLLALNDPADGVPTVTAKFGMGGAVHVGPVGGSLMTSIAIDSNGSVCLESELCTSGGAGIFGNLGGEVSIDIGTNPLATGESATAGAFAEGGAGSVIGGSIKTDALGNISGGRGIFGVGGGVAGGLLVCQTTTICF